jgi:hypothetical protein
VLQDNYESGDFEYEEKLDWEKTKKLTKIRTNLCVILQARSPPGPPARTAAVHSGVPSVV